MKTSLAAVFLCIALAPSAVAQSAKCGFFKTSDGIRIHYLEAGSGRPIVFIPGWTMPAWIWQPQIDEFSKKYHVVAVDPRSQGESDKPHFGHLPERRARDYQELVNHLGLKQPVLVGWSMGVPELFKYAELFGTDNVAGLALVDGFVVEKPTVEAFMGLSGWMNQLQRDRQKHADLLVRSMYKKPQPEEYLKRVMETSMQVPADTAVVLIFNMLAAQDFAGAFARMNRPMLFAYAPDTQPGADFLKSKLGGKVRLERFEGEGHALFVDNPEKFNRILEDFIQTLLK